MFLKRVNYINGVSTFLFFLFWCLNFFLFNQVSKLFYFFYLGVSTLFLFNQVYKLFIFFYFCVSTLSLFNQMSKLFFFFLIWCVNFIFIQSNV